MLKYKNLSASGLVKTGSGQVWGITINSHSSGTIKIWNNTSATGDVIHNTMTLAVGERTITLFGESFSTGLYITIGGTADITVAYK